MFTLRTTLTSPFGRKVRISADVLGLADQIELVASDTLDPADPLRAVNPLGKMPCLLLPDGSALYDSGVIIEYLQEQAATDILLPLSGAERYRGLTLARLADGIAEAALLMVYESRFREADQISERWLDHQRGKVLRGLGAFEAHPLPLRLDLPAIGLACALAYLDWRKPLPWRAEHPRLVAWLDHLSAEYSILETSRAPETR